MAFVHPFRNSFARSIAPRARLLSLALGLTALSACVRTPAAMAPGRDPRIGLRAGLMDAGQASWNVRLLSATPPSDQFLGMTNSDMAFSGNYVIQGSYNGYQVWDIGTPSRPTLKTAYVCPASQSDVSVYRNLLFVSGEGLTGRLDCGSQGVRERVSDKRLRGLRIFDISDIMHPKNVGNVQTCRGSHTHSVLADPRDADNVYVYISGSADIRSERELAGCVSASPKADPSSALFRIEVIKVPLAHPEQAAIVSTPRIFNDLVAPPRHGETAPDIIAERQEVVDARARGEFTGVVHGTEEVLRSSFVDPLLDSIVAARNGTGLPTSADSAALRRALPSIMATMHDEPLLTGDGRQPGPTQCHDITVYPAIGLAGGACEGYGFLLDIRDPAHPTRLAAVADSNFSYWHSATFNNDGSKVLFSDEWGGGSQAKCRVTDKREWGANAIFTLDGGTPRFRSYYKLPVTQTPQENCVAHNGSLIPIPGRDVMAQSWYQGGITVFDWTDATRPVEIAFFDRGPMDATRLVFGGTWSAYWYNGMIISSETGRGLDILELTPSAFVSQNEIDAAKTVVFEYFNTQGQQRLIWPASFALARAYVDQLERSQGLPAMRLAAVRQGLASAENASGAQRQGALTELSGQLDSDASAAGDAAKVRMLAAAVRDLAGVSR